MFVVTVIGIEPYPTDVRRETISVIGMSCTGCEQTVEDALKNVDGVTRVDADRDGDSVDVVVEDDVSDDDLHATIERACYDVAA